MSRTRNHIITHKHTDILHVHMPQSFCKLLGCLHTPSTTQTSGTTHYYTSLSSNPLTSLALNSSHTILFSGSWDKSIISWSTSTTTPQRRYHHGHTDFVKAVATIIIANKELLISGAADATIIIWDIATAARLHTLKGHTRGVLALAADPLAHRPFNSGGSDATESALGVCFFSAGSDREVRLWQIGSDAVHALELQPITEAHETSVNALCFDDEGDLWSASSDGTVKHLNRERAWDVEETFTHGDYVRGVALSADNKWVVSVGRDETVKVWERGIGELKHTYKGHFGEIMGVVIMKGVVVSVSVDGTVRRWSLDPGEMERDGQRGGEDVEEEKREVPLEEDEDAELEALNREMDDA